MGDYTGFKEAQKIAYRQFAEGLSIALGGPLEWASGKPKVVQDYPTEKELLNQRLARLEKRIEDLEMKNERG